jgi:hypothetical protein
MTRSSSSPSFILPKNPKKQKKMGCRAHFSFSRCAAKHTTNGCMFKGFGAGTRTVAERSLGAVAATARITHAARRAG